LETITNLNIYCSAVILKATIMGTRNEPPSKTTIEPLRGKSDRTFVGSVIILAAFLLVLMGSETLFLHLPSINILGSTSISQADHSMCEKICEKHTGKNRYYGKPDDLLDTKKLIQRVVNARQNLIDDLRKDYGETFFSQIFQDESTGKFRPIKPTTSYGPSMDRLNRKLLIKILSVQSYVNQLGSQCDCEKGNKALAVLSRATNEMALSSPFFEKYVWGTGGHSSAAGHGNLYNESYTAFLERDLADVFGTVGIEFIGRNYAMGGTSSGSEIAMCFEQIFGSDVDFFSWDFGMTDGGVAEKILFYGIRGGLSPGRPAYMGIHLGGNNRVERERKIEDLEKLGMAGFMFEDASLSRMKAAIPDSALLSEEELSALPEYVRNFKCNGGYETGEPFCTKEKFSHYICDKRGKQGSWHPGFKDHAMTGHGIALFLTDALVSALKSLEVIPADGRELYLEKLREEEAALFRNISESSLPKSNYIQGLPSNFDRSIFYQGRSFCHTGRLPSQIRYMGYLTESDRVGGPAPWGQATYDEGVEKKIAMQTDAYGVMRLVWEPKVREWNCPVTCSPDAKDSFMTSYKDGWTKLSLPNNAEKKAYQYDPAQFKGIIILVLRSCDWGKCEAGFLKAEDYHDKKWEMKVNGKEVESLVHLGHEAWAANGSEGMYFSPNSRDDYDIEINVIETDSFLLVTSFILY
jgi:hypothetical protein